MAPHLRTALINAALLWVVAGWSTCATAQPARIAILYHEPLAELQMRSSAELRTFAKPHLRELAEPAIQRPDLRFTGFGRDFQLVLEPNKALIRGLSLEQQDALDAIDVYRGRIIDVEGSWARISRVGTEVSGLIFDGAEYFAIDSLDRVADRLRTPQSDVGGAVIYRLRDTIGLIQDEVVEPVAPTARAGSQRSSVLPNFASGVVLGQQIDIGVLGDFEFGQLVGASKADDSLIRLINIVDGIFLEGLGVHINLVGLQSYNAEPDPFESGNPGVLLGELEGVKEDSAEWRPLGLLHLFTGRDLGTSSSSAELLGIANRGVLCEPRRGVGLTKYRGGSAIDAIVAAHEIGHNFGAPHDAEPGSVCAAAPPGMLMDASFSSSTEFSQCSIDQILIETASATCLTPLLPANMTLWLTSNAPPSVVEPEVGYEFDIAMENTSGVDAVDVELIIDAPSMHVVLVDRRGALPDRCDIFVFGRSYRCFWSEFSDGERFDATVSFRASTPGEPASIAVGVTSQTESDSTGDSLHFDVDVLPYVNLAASFNPPALSLRPDAHGSVTASIRNIGTESATEVIAHVQVPQKLEFLGASIGQCVWDGDTYLFGYDCPVGTLTPNESVDFVVDFRPRAGLSATEIKSGANIAVRASSFEPERPIDSHDNSFSARITLGTSIGDLVLGSSAVARAFVGDTITVAIFARNDGPDTVHDVVVGPIDLSGLAQPEITGMTATGASCQLPVSDRDPLCEITQLAPGEALTLTFSITTRSAGDFLFIVGSDMSSSDPNSGNDDAAILVTVQPRPPPPTPAPAPSPPPNTGGGGGGGALDELTLSLLGLVLILAKRRAALRRKSRTEASKLAA